MKGALVFLGIFLIVLLATIVNSDLPPGKQIYDALGVAATDYKVIGIAATTLIEAVFNGVVYGVIAWIIYSIADRATKKKPVSRAPQNQK